MMHVFWWSESSVVETPRLWHLDREMGNPVVLHDHKMELPRLIELGYTEISARTAYALGLPV